MDKFIFECCDYDTKNTNLRCALWMGNITLTEKDSTDDLLSGLGDLTAWVRSTYYAPIEPKNIKLKNVKLSGMLRHGLWVSGVNGLTLESVAFENNGGRASDYATSSTELKVPMPNLAFYKDLYKKVYDSERTEKDESVDYSVVILDLLYGTNNSGANPNKKFWSGIRYGSSIDMEIHNAYESLDNIELFKVTSFGTPFNGIHFNKSTASVILNDCKIDERCCVNGQ
jgi:hypothetical protein